MRRIRIALTGRLGHGGRVRVALGFAPRRSTRDTLVEFARAQLRDAA
jgi:hypothetical protein